jgi:hypothetical protein
MPGLAVGLLAIAGTTPAPPEPRRAEAEVEPREYGESGFGERPAVVRYSVELIGAEPGDVAWDWSNRVDDVDCRDAELSGFAVHNPMVETTLSRERAVSPFRVRAGVSVLEGAPCIHP